MDACLWRERASGKTHLDERFWVDTHGTNTATDVVMGLDSEGYSLGSFVFMIGVTKSIT